LDHEDVLQKILENYIEIVDRRSHIITLISNVRGERMNGGFHHKYRKYKSKYLNLKKMKY
jgi:hypothetical protein